MLPLTCGDVRRCATLPGFSPPCALVGSRWALPAAKCLVRRVVESSRLRLGRSDCPSRALDVVGQQLPELGR
jgi:hypothetical protein